MDGRRGADANAGAWLIHPVTLVSFVVLAVNDHVLKAAYGTWWTGKLSDVAGLIAFPALLGLLLAWLARAVWRPLSSGVAVWIPVVATGIGFAWVKLTQTGASAASALLSSVAGPGIVRADASDLLALPALGLAAWVGLRCVRMVDARRPGANAGAGRWGALRGTVLPWVVLPFAVAVTVATSASYPTASVVEGPEGDPVVMVLDGATSLTYAWDGDAWAQQDLSSLGWSPDRHTPLMTDQCVPGDEQTCFRVVDSGIGVERSDDGGQTWMQEWALTHPQVDDIEAQHAFAIQELESSIGVFASGTGYIVVFAAAYDGLTVRAPDGTWQRLGLTVLDCCEAMPITELGPPEPSPLQPVVSHWVLAAPFVAMNATLATASLVRRRMIRPIALPGQAEKPTRLTFRVTWVVVSVLVALGLWMEPSANAMSSRPGADPTWSIPPLVYTGVIGAVAVLVAMGALGLLRDRMRRVTLGLVAVGMIGAAATGALLDLVAPLSGGVEWMLTVVAAVAGCLAAQLVVVKRVGRAVDDAVQPALGSAAVTPL